VFFIKKGKKIELVIPILAELQVHSIDALSFEIYWDPGAFERPNHSQIHTGDFVIPGVPPFRLRFIAHNA
jgi:hypothetical protein